jgi:hypothetical protein
MFIFAHTYKSKIVTVKAMETYRDWSYFLLLINLGNRWKWVSSFILQPLYPRGRSPVPTTEKGV